MDSFLLPHANNEHDGRGSLDVNVWDTGYNRRRLLLFRRISFLPVRVERRNDSDDVPSDIANYTILQQYCNSH